MREWKVERAMAYGATLGVAAAMIKLFAPWGARHSMAGNLREVAGAALAFALLCGIAVLIRNVIARRLLRSEVR